MGAFAGPGVEGDRCNGGGGDGETEDGDPAATIRALGRVHDEQDLAGANRRWALLEATGRGEEGVGTGRDRVAGQVAPDPAGTGRGVRVSVTSQ